MLRRLVRQAIATETSQQKLEPQASHDNVRRRDRLTIQLHPVDRRALQERGAARNITAARYVTALVRAHLNTQPRLPKEEFLVLRALVEELNEIAPTLNVLVQSANEDKQWAEPLKDTLNSILQLFERISVRLREFARTNRRSWDAKLTDE